MKSFLEMMKKAQTKNSKSYFFCSSKTRVICLQSIYISRNLESTFDSSIFKKVRACVDYIEKLAKFTPDLIQKLHLIILFFLKL